MNAKKQAAKVGLLAYLETLEGTTAELLEHVRDTFQVVISLRTPVGSKLSQTPSDTFFIGNLPGQPPISFNSRVQVAKGLNLRPHVKKHERKAVRSSHQVATNKEVADNHEGAAPFAAENPRGSEVSNQAGASRPKRRTREPKRMTFDQLGGERGRRRSQPPKSVMGYSMGRHESELHPLISPYHDKQGLQQQHQGQQQPQFSQGSVVSNSPQGQAAITRTVSLSSAFSLHHAALPSSPPAIVPQHFFKNQAANNLPSEQQHEEQFETSSPASRCLQPVHLDLEPAEAAAGVHIHQTQVVGLHEAVTWMASFILHAKGNYVELIDRSGLVLASQNALCMQYVVEGECLRIKPLLYEEPPEGWTLLPVATPADQLGTAFDSRPTYTGSAVTAMLSSKAEGDNGEDEWALLDLRVPGGKVVEVRQDGGLRLEDGCVLPACLSQPQQPVQLQLQPQQLGQQGPMVLHFDGLETRPAAWAASSLNSSLLTTRSNSATQSASASMDESTFPRSFANATSVGTADLGAAQLAIEQRDVMVTQDQLDKGPIGTGDTPLLDPVAAVDTPPSAFPQHPPRSLAQRPADMRIQVQDLLHQGLICNASCSKNDLGHEESPSYYTRRSS